MAVKPVAGPQRALVSAHAARRLRWVALGAASLLGTAGGRPSSAAGARTRSGLHTGRVIAVASPAARGLWATELARSHPVTRQLF